MPSYQVGGYNLGGSGYIDPSDASAKNIKQRKDDFYQSNYTGNSALWLQGAIDKRFKVGDQSLYSYMAGANYNQNYARWFFNLIMRHINMIGGYQRKNRKSTITLPVHETDDGLSDDYNKVIRWCEDRDGFQEYLSQCFEGALDTGQTLLWLYADYTFDPISGDLFTDSVSYNNYLIDQFYRKQDLSDCNGVWRRRWVSKEGAKLLVPGYTNEIDRMRPDRMKDGRFPVQAELQNIAINNLFTFDEFHYRSTRKAKIVMDPKTGESAEWDEEGEDSEDLLKQTLMFQPWLKVKEVEVPTARMCLSIGDKEIYDGPNQLNLDTYPCVPALCYHEPDIPQYSLRCMGIVRNLRDAQFLYNMRKVIELQLLQSQINAGWIFPIDAVTDVKAFRQSSGGDGFLIPLKAGHLPNEVQRIEPSAIPQSLLELSASLAEDITKISGVNEELLGAATDDKSGVLSMLRQGAGLITLQKIFDKLDYTQRLYGKLRLEAICKNFSKGKVKNILGHEAHPKFFSSYSRKYSIAVEEGNYSATQRQTELQQLLYFKELGMNIADKSIMRAAIITNKKQIIEEMEEQNQAQAQQQQAEIQSQSIKDQAKVRVDLAKEQELMASAQEKLANIGKTEAQAEHETMKADYELVKIMMELEDMQLGQIKASFELAESLKLANSATSNANLNRQTA